MIVLDDATDPTKGVTNAKPLHHRRQGRHHHGLGCHAGGHRDGRHGAESETPQLRGVAGGRAARQDTWMFRLPQGNAVMAYAMIEHMKKHGVKTVGFLG